MEIGEEYKDYAMKWDAIAPDRIEEVWGYGFKEPFADALMAKLTKQSIERREKLDEFKLWNERINWVKERQQKKDWSLNYNVREGELKADEDFNKSFKERQKKFTDADYPKTEVLLDSAKENAKPEKKKQKSASKTDALDASEDDEDAPDFDVQLHETLRIMGDWIDTAAHPETLAPFVKKSGEEGGAADTSAQPETAQKPASDGADKSAEKGAAD